MFMFWTSFRTFCHDSFFGVVQRFACYSVRGLHRTLANRSSSSTGLESESAPGAFVCNPAPVLDEISGPMGAQFLSSIVVGLGALIERPQYDKYLLVKALDRNVFPNSPLLLFRNEKAHKP